MSIWVLRGGNGHHGTDGVIEPELSPARQLSTQKVARPVLQRPDRSPPSGLRRGGESRRWNVSRPLPPRARTDPLTSTWRFCLSAPLPPRSERQEDGKKELFETERHRSPSGRPPRRTDAVCVCVCVSVCVCLEESFVHNERKCGGGGGGLLM